MGNAFDEILRAKPLHVVDGAWAIATSLAWLHQHWAVYRDEWAMVETKALGALSSLISKAASTDLLECATNLLMKHAMACA